MENRFRPLLQRYVEGQLSKSGERSFIQAHTLHFRRRIERLPAGWFPGREKSKEAIQSLANGAYAHLAHEPVRRHLTAFEVAYLDYEGTELSWLYYWPRSACMQWMKRQAFQQLAPGERLRRKARKHLEQGGFDPLCSARGEPAWAPSSWTLDRRHRLPPPLESVNVDVHGMRAKDVLRSILETVEAPLTLTQLVDIWARSLSMDPQEQYAQDLDDARDAHQLVDAHIAKNELLHRVRHFWEGRLAPHERALLKARGYGGERRLRPFRQVAEELGMHGPERWRQIERGLLDMARDVFEGEPKDEVALLLSFVINESRQAQ